MSFAVTTPINASWAPTERSIPPEMRTNDIPMVMIVKYVICRIIVMKLLKVKKLELPILKITIKPSNIIDIPNPLLFNCFLILNCIVLFLLLVITGCVIQNGLLIEFALPYIRGYFTFGKNHHAV